MKFIITKAINRLELIKFFRDEIRGLPLQDAVYYANNLPYSWNELSPYTVQDLQERTKNFAESKSELEAQDEEFDICNININPPPEYIQAMAWYETLSQGEKNHIEQIVSWWNKPAVC